MIQLFKNLFKPPCIVIWELTIIDNKYPGVDQRMYFLLYKRAKKFWDKCCNDPDSYTVRLGGVELWLW